MDGTDILVEPHDALSHSESLHRAWRTVAGAIESGKIRNAIAR
jgi:hypothetical protein